VVELVALAVARLLCDLLWAVGSFDLAAVADRKNFGAIGLLVARRYMD
jgi:hypothetical protein